MLYRLVRCPDVTLYRLVRCSDVTRFHSRRYHCRSCRSCCRYGSEVTSHVFTTMTPALFAAPRHRGLSAPSTSLLPSSSRNPTKPTASDISQALTATASTYPFPMLPPPSLSSSGERIWSMSADRAVAVRRDRKYVQS